MTWCSPLSDVLQFLAQIGEPTAARVLRSKADELKQRIEDLCFDKSELAVEPDEGCSSGSTKFLQWYVDAF